MGEESSPPRLLLLLYCVRNSQEWVVDVKLCVQLLLNCEFFRSFSRFDGSERKAKAERGRERERESGRRIVKEKEG